MVTDSISNQDWHKNELTSLRTWKKKIESSLKKDIPLLEKSSTDPIKASEMVDDILFKYCIESLEAAGKERGK